jgi:hypothetical protein
MTMNDDDRPDRPGSGNGTPADDEAYEAMLALDEMESLLEDIEEEGLPASATIADLPPQLAGRMDELGARSVGELRDRIRQLHEELDLAEG